jgi:hypothetical protein
MPPSPSWPSSTARSVWTSDPDNIHARRHPGHQTRPRHPHRLNPLRSWRADCLTRCIHRELGWDFALEVSGGGTQVAHSTRRSYALPWSPGRRADTPTPVRRSRPRGAGPRANGSFAVRNVLITRGQSAALDTVRRVQGVLDPVLLGAGGRELLVLAFSPPPHSGSNRRHSGGEAPVSGGDAGVSLKQAWTPPQRTLVVAALRSGLATWEGDCKSTVMRSPWSGFPLAGKLARYRIRLPASFSRPDGTSSDTPWGWCAQWRGRSGQRENRPARNTSQGGFVSKGSSGGATWGRYTRHGISWRPKAPPMTPSP